MFTRITHRRQKDGKNTLFRTNKGDMAPSAIAKKINAREVFLVGNSKTKVIVVKDKNNVFIKSKGNKTDADDIEKLPEF